MEISMFLVILIDLGICNMICLPKMHPRRETFHIFICLFRRRAENKFILVKIAQIVYF